MRQILKIVVVGEILSLLAGCMAAPLISAVAVQKMQADRSATAGAVEVTVDVSKVTEVQRAHIRNITSFAVWPDRQGNSVSLAESLSLDNRFTIISPSQVAATLKKLDLPDDLNLMTSTETKNVFSKVDQNTNADAVIYTKATGENRSYGITVFAQGDRTLHFLSVIATKDGVNVEIPISLKYSLGNKAPSSAEIANLTNAELAKNILALASNQKTKDAVLGAK